ncbi:MAG TPA: hypothetical protein VH598_02115, partial [Verrucomicrobiae bacterium]|nr:hypothetical protein [Verrucomicrobiae bacterium]
QSLAMLQRMDFQGEQMFKAGHCQGDAFDTCGFGGRKQLFKSGCRNKHEIQVPLRRVFGFKLEKRAPIVAKMVTQTADKFQPQSAIFFANQNVSVLSAALKAMLDDRVGADNQKPQPVSCGGFVESGEKRHCGKVCTSRGIRASHW